MNIITKRYKNTSNLGICIFPADTLRNDELRNRMMDFTLFYAIRLNQIVEGKPVQVHYVDSIDSGMAEYHNQYDHVLFMAAGVRIYNMEILFEIERTITENPRYLAAAHILDWRERWYELHQQFVLVNSQNWGDAGQPAFGGWIPQTESLPVIERSVENFHDDYTPLWIKFTGEYTEQRHSCPGWSYLNAASRNDYTVINWDNSVRLKRTYYYPESQSEHFLNSLKTLTNCGITNPNQMRLLEQCMWGSRQIWILNSEYMQLDNTGQIYDTVALPAAGFKFLDVFKGNILAAHCRHCDARGQLIIYDFNQYSLDWVEHLYHSQNTDILSLISTYENKMFFKIAGNNTFESDGQFTDAFKTSYRITMDYFGGENAFVNYLTRFRSASVKFIKLDLINEPEKLTSEFSGQTLVNISNIYCTDAGNAIYGLTKTRESYKRFINSIGVDCTVVGQDPDCVHVTKRISND
jgi:hypothetical protein